MKTKSERLNNEYRVHIPGAGLGVTATIDGPSLKEAITRNFQAVAQVASLSGPLGNAAGYVLDDVRAQYTPGILGGRGGVEITILSHGMDLAHRLASINQICSTVWVYADPSDMPHPVVFDLR